MFTVLFWNLGESDDALCLLAPLARETAADVVVVAECFDAAGALAVLNRPAPDYYLVPGRSRVEVFTRFNTDAMFTAEDHRLYTLRGVTLADDSPLLLAAAHLPSGLQTPLDGRNEICRNFARQVQTAEARVGHRRTVVIGDLNLNPFDAGVAFAGGLHGVADRRIAQLGSRHIQEMEYPFFYNPMWRFFGDERLPCGSYYYWKSEHAAYFWHLYDQVLLRPALVNHLPNNGVELVTTIGGIGLLDGHGRPNRSIGSDHLPLVLRLDL